jgi:hypothetical protein
VSRPSISIELFKAAYELDKEMRPLIKIQDTEETVLIPSKKSLMNFSGQETAMQLADLYSHLKSEDEDQHPFDSWEQYKQIRSKFHFIRRSAVWPGFDL